MLIQPSIGFDGGHWAGGRVSSMAAEVICLRDGEAKVQDGSMIQVNILFEFPDSYLGISGSSRLVHIS